MLIDLIRRVPPSPSARESAGLRKLRDSCGACEYTDGVWQLTYQPQWLALRALRQSLADVTGDDGGVSLIGEVDSTNKRIRRYRRQPFFLFAEYQRRGRGSYGRGWLALPAGSITMSAMFIAPPQPSGLSVAVGGALCEALSPFACLRFKWPNDILDADGNKVAGILTEVADGRVIIGVGLNRDMPGAFARCIARMGAAERADATDEKNAAPAGGLLPLLQKPLSRQETAVLLARTVAATVAVFTRCGFPYFRPTAQRFHTVGIGEPLTFGAQKNRCFAGFADDGNLLTHGN